MSTHRLKLLFHGPLFLENGAYLPGGMRGIKSFLWALPVYIAWARQIFLAWVCNAIKLISFRNFKVFSSFYFFYLQWCKSNWLLSVNVSSTYVNFRKGGRFYIGWKKVGLRWPYEAGIIYHIYTWSFWIISLCILCMSSNQERPGA